VSALAAYVLSGLVSAGLAVQWGFLVLAGLSLVGAVLGYIGVPSQDEFYERAKQVLATDLPRNHTNIFKILRDTFNIMWQVKGASVISFLCIGSPYIFVIYFVSAVDEYLPLMIAEDQANKLIFVFAILVAVIGGVVTPFLGLLMDRIGPFFFYCLMAVALGIFTGTLFVANFPAQIIALVSAILYQAIWSTFAQRWCVYLTPPHLLGSYMGIVVAFVGILTVIACIAVPNALASILTGLAFYKWPLVLMAALSNLAALVTLIYLRIVGVPETPPTPIDHWGSRPTETEKTVN
jgi:MFS family permease